MHIEVNGRRAAPRALCNSVLPGEDTSCCLRTDMLTFSSLSGQETALPAPELVPLTSHAGVGLRMAAQRRGKLLLRARGPWTRRRRKASRERVSACSPVATRIARSPTTADSSAPARTLLSTAAPGGDHDDSLRGDVSSASSPQTLPASRSVPITPDASAVPEDNRRRPRAPAGTSGLASPATMAKDSNNSESAPLRDASLDASS